MFDMSKTERFVADVGPFCASLDAAFGYTAVVLDAVVESKSASASRASGPPATRATTGGPITLIWPIS